MDSREPDAPNTARRPKWPGGARCAVALTFDVDAESPFLFQEHGEKRPKALSIGTYGPLRGVPRILELLERQSVRATFFVPGWTTDNWPDSVAAISQAGHEIGVHGYLHEEFSSLTPAQQRDCHERALAAAERVTGRRPVGVRPPGEYTPETLRIVHEMGFLYDSNLRGDDRPYRIRIDGKPTRLVEICPHWQLDDGPYFSFGFGSGYAPVRILSPQIAYDAWRSEFDGYYREGLCFVLMTHPELTGTPGRAMMLERLIEHMKGHEGVWFATCEEIARWWLESGQP